MTTTPAPDPADPRRLRLVPPPEMPITTTQVADFPGAYAVRRGGPAEAIVHRGKGGDWYVMYNHDPAAKLGADAWRGSATLSGELSDQDVAAAALALVEASARLDVAPLWPELLGRLFDVGGAVLLLGKLHAPDHLGYCTGENIPGLLTDERVRWHECKTVRILASSVGVNLPPARGR